MNLFIGIGLAHLSLGHYPEALDCQKYYLCLSQGNANSKLRALSNIGEVLIKMRKFNEAMKIFEKQLSVARQAGDVVNEANAFASLANCQKLAEKQERGGLYYKQEFRSATRKSCGNGESSLSAPPACDKTAPSPPGTERSASAPPAIEKPESPPPPPPPDMEKSTPTPSEMEKADHIAVDIEDTPPTPPESVKSAPIPMARRFAVKEPHPRNLIKIPKNHLNSTKINEISLKIFEKSLRIPENVCFR